MMRMELRGFFSEFTKYNKKILKKLIILGILVLYFAFLIFYNHFRINLDYSVEGSWIFGIISGLISTVVLIFTVDTLWFLYKKRK